MLGYLYGCFLKTLVSLHKQHYLLSWSMFLKSNLRKKPRKKPREFLPFLYILWHCKKPEYPKPFEDEIQNMQFRDLFYTKIPRALRFNDRVSMAYSTELREPFLDYRLVEFGFSLPIEFKIKGQQNKRILNSYEILNS